MAAQQKPQPTGAINEPLPPPPQAAIAQEITPPPPPGAEAQRQETSEKVLATPAVRKISMEHNVSIWNGGGDGRGLAHNAQLLTLVGLKILQLSDTIHSLSLHTHTR